MSIPRGPQESPERIQSNSSCGVASQPHPRLLGPHKHRTLPGPVFSGLVPVWWQRAWRPLLSVVLCTLLCGADATLGASLSCETSRVRLPLSSAQNFTAGGIIPRQQSPPSPLPPPLAPAFGVLLRGPSACRARPPHSSCSFSGLTGGPPSIASAFWREVSERPLTDCTQLRAWLGGVLSTPQPQQHGIHGAANSGASPVARGGPLYRSPVGVAGLKGASLALIGASSLSDALRKAARRLGEALPTAGKSKSAVSLSGAPAAVSETVLGLKKFCRGRVGSALWVRVCTGVPLALAAVGAVLLSPLPAFAALAWAQSLLGLGEFLALCQRKRFAVPPLAGTAAANALVMAAAATNNSEAHLLAEAAAICGHLVASLISPPSQRGISDLGASVFGHVWCAFLPSFWVRLRALQCPRFDPYKSKCQQQQQQAAAEVGEAAETAESPAATDGEGDRPQGFLSRFGRRCVGAAKDAREALMTAIRAPWGPRWLVLYGFLLIAVNDSVAYFMGSYFGQTSIAALFPLIRGTPLPPAALVSPRKTVLGLATGAATGTAVGAALGAALGATAARQASKAVHSLPSSRRRQDATPVPPGSFARACVLAFRPGERAGSLGKKVACVLGLGAVGGCMGLAVSATAVAGDLLASLLKRDAGVKDSGALLPGHGGWLDRTDAHLLAGPLVFVFGRALQCFLFQLEAAATEQQQQLQLLWKEPPAGFSAPTPQADHRRQRHKFRRGPNQDAS